MIRISAKVTDVQFYAGTIGGHSFTVHYQYERHGMTHRCNPQHGKLPLMSYLEARQRANMEYPLESTRTLYVHPDNYLHCMEYKAMKEYSSFASGVFAFWAMLVILFFIVTFADDAK